MPQIDRRSIPSLDGLRAISVGMVILCHLTILPGFSGSWLPAGIMSGLGSLGVRVFFVISGFLITQLLFRELDRDKQINLLKFYFRRTLRIFPAYYVFLAVIFIFSTFGIMGVSLGRFWPALSYTSDYFSTITWFTGHTWSLSVEEQFYLLWPTLLVLAGKTRGMLIAVAFICLSPAIRVLTIALFFRHNATAASHHFETVADALATGCVLAWADKSIRSSSVYQMILASRSFIVVPIVLFAIELFLPGIGYKFLYYIVFGMTISNVCVALCIHRCIIHSSGKLGKVLNWRPLAFVGVLSYSIYLWQQLFLSPKSPFAFPFVLAPIGVTACASYFLVEQPFLKLRYRFENQIFRVREKERIQEHGLIAIAD